MLSELKSSKMVNQDHIEEENNKRKAVAKHLWMFVAANVPSASTEKLPEALTVLN